MEDKEIRIKAIELLIQWSKWLIAINFSAGTGCIVVLKLDSTDPDKVGLQLFAAVLFFVLSVICSSLYVWLLAHEVEKPPSTDIKFKWLGQAQWGLFALGFLFFIWWVGIAAKVF